MLPHFPASPTDSPWPQCWLGHCICCQQIIAMFFLPAQHIYSKFKLDMALYVSIISLTNALAGGSLKWKSPLGPQLSPLRH